MANLGPNVQVTPNVTAGMVNPAQQNNVVSVDSLSSPNALQTTAGVIGNLAAPNGVSFNQAAQVNPLAAPYLLQNPRAIPMQYNPADPQCVLARTFCYDSGGATQAPQALEIGTLNAVPTTSGATYDALLGLVFSGTANNALSLDVSNLTSLQSATAYMIYMEVERSFLAELPTTPGLTNTGDYSGGIPLVNATQSLFAFWPSAEGITTNGMILREQIAYTSGTGDKNFQGYGANPTASTSYTFSATYFHDAVLYEGDTHVPVVFAVDGTQCALYVAGVCVSTPNGNFAAGTTVPLGPLKTIVFGRRFAGDSQNSYADGHIRNLMVIAGRSPFYGKSYGPQHLLPTTVFSNTLMFGDSYSDPDVTPQSVASNGGILATCAPSIQTPGYLRKYGYATTNMNEVSSWTNSSVVANCTFGGRAFIGFNSGTAPVNGLPCDTVAFPTTSGETYLWDQFALYLAQSPTCCILQSATNDRYPTPANYSRWLKYYLERLFGVNGNAATTIKAVVVCTTPYPPLFADGSSPRRRKQMLDVWTACYATVAWFQAQYPALANYITIADVYSAIGGQNSYAQYFTRPSGTDVHMGPVGKLIQGQVWAQALLNLQSQINGTAMLPSSVTPINPLRQYYAAAPNSVRLLGVLRGANFNVTTDQAINLQQLQQFPGGTKYYISNILVTNASISLTTAAGGFYTATAKGGTTLVAATQVYSALTSASVPLSVTLAAGATGTVYSTAATVVANDQTGFAAPIYFSLTTAQGAAATADIYVFGYDLT